jgi:hypothetical protein
MSQVSPTALQYTVAIRIPSYDNDPAVIFGSLPRPEILPNPGDTLVVKVPFVTMAGFTYNVGDEMLLLERTMESPYGRLSSLMNWKVKCPYFTSVWTGIEAMLAEGEIAVASSQTSNI